MKTACTATNMMRLFENICVRSAIANQKVSSILLFSLFSFNAHSYELK